MDYCQSGKLASTLVSRVFTPQTGLIDWLVDRLWFLSASGSASRLHPKSRCWSLLWLHFVEPRKGVTDCHFKSPCWDYLLRTKAPRQTLSYRSWHSRRTEQNCIPGAKGKGQTFFWKRLDSLLGMFHSRHTLHLKNLYLGWWMFRLFQLLFQCLILWWTFMYKSLCS